MLEQLMKELGGGGMSPPPVKGELGDFLIEGLMDALGSDMPSYVRQVVEASKALRRAKTGLERTNLILEELPLSKMDAQPIALMLTMTKDVNDLSNKMSDMCNTKLIPEYVNKMAQEMADDPEVAKLYEEHNAGKDGDVTKAIRAKYKELKEIKEAEQAASVLAPKDKIDG